MNFSWTNTHLFSAEVVAMVSDEIRVTTNIIGFGIEIDFTDSVSVFDFMNDLLQRDMCFTLSNPTECHRLLYFPFLLFVFTCCRLMSERCG